MDFSDDDDMRNLSINKTARKIKKSQASSLYNALRSIYEDSAFVAEIGGLWPDLPLVANLRCGLWYTPRFDATCYFKSTDGHQNNWSFSTARLNLHLAILSGQQGGCVIVDSTRKGKIFPDSMSKTIPIWCCVLNRSIYNHLQLASQVQKESPSAMSWDTSLHLPLGVPETERAAIESRMPYWIDQFECCGADISSLAHCLKKPLRPLWISQNTLIWLNEVPPYESWDFTPVILVSASGQDGLIKQSVQAEFSWRYIPGAGDDEESWARGLTPDLFWKNAFNIIDAGPEACNRMVSEIIEKDRVYRSQRGECLPQVKVGASRSLTCEELGGQVNHCSGIDRRNDTKLADLKGIFRIGSTGVAVASILNVSDELVGFDCVLNCDASGRISVNVPSDAYLCLPIVSSKIDRFSLYKSLRSAVSFAKSHLLRGKRMLICCQSGEDISICVCLAILTSLFDESEKFDGGESFKKKNLTKWEMRKRLVYICNFAINARPSRGNLKQVYGFLTSKEVTLIDSII